MTINEPSANHSELMITLPVVSTTSGDGAVAATNPAVFDADADAMVTAPLTWVVTALTLLVTFMFSFIPYDFSN